MKKAYWIGCFRCDSQSDAHTAYAELARPAVTSVGGRFLAYGEAAMSYESGVLERTVVVEFDSLECAMAAFESDEYQAARKALGRRAERDFRIVGGCAE